MIHFEHKLPAMNIDGKHNGTYNNRELAMPGVLTTTDSSLGEFLYKLRTEIYTNRRIVYIDGKMLRCNINWIRDHVHIMKATKHWEYDLRSFLDFIIETQRKDGQFYELIKQYDDYHWKLVNEDCYVLYPQDNLTLVRLEIEADIEYLVVEGAMQYYQVTGDDEWMKKVLPKLEKSIEYMTSDEKRWDKEYGLVKRPFTIDTWDFVYAKEGTPDNRRIEKNTPMSIMHGDNSGVYQAMNQLAWFNRRFGNEDKAAEWGNRAENLKNNMFKHLWNGKFFIHQLHLNHSGADDKENMRLSLSNTYAVNRGVTNPGQSRLIIEEYMSRKNKTGQSAEWFTVDPPYEKFRGHKAGRYVNGAISPFTAGELAKAAFNNGYEEYGWSILSRFVDMVKRDGTVYFLYDPDLTPQPEGGPSAWGAAALLSAVDEGLAGIVDIDTGYKKIYFSPKFPVTHYTELRYITGYELTDTKVDVTFILKDDGMRYDIESPAGEIYAHILLPREKVCSKVSVNSKEQNFDPVTAGNSKYVDFSAVSDGKLNIEILF
ncbi:MAG: MGH1-like glycoside hydrolase domain-containing protein [Eubacteriales bacterium]